MILSSTVGPNKEWKPKPININVQDSGIAAAPEAPTILVEATAQTQHDTSVLDMEEATFKTAEEAGGVTSSTTSACYSSKQYPCS